MQLHRSLGRDKIYLYTSEKRSEYFVENIEDDEVLHSLLPH